MKSAIKDIKFRRRAKSITDYKKRLALVKGGIDRVVVRRSNRRIIGQVIRYSPKGDIVIAHADSFELEKLGWPSHSNRPTAYLTGLLLSRKAGKEASNEHILDIGLSSPVRLSVPFVFAKGCEDGGLKIRNSISIDEKVYNCSNTEYISKMKAKDAAKYKNHYSSYKDIGGLKKSFEEAKSNILKGATLSSD